MAGHRVRYRSHDEDSARWESFNPRSGDIVISTRSKSGTTWMQMICALLVFGTDQLPEPLGELSPWLDWLGRPIDDVVAKLDHQDHRRIIKTHTPLDGVPLHPEVTYIVVARQPLDMALSLFHQSHNIDRGRLAELTGNPSEGQGTAEADPAPWLRRWIAWEGDPAERLDSLPGVLWHLGDAWARRHQPNVVVVRYRDLLADLPGQMVCLADQLDVSLDEPTIRRLSETATFDRMRDRSELLAPDPMGILKDRRAFFRGGRAGDGSALLGDEDLAAYRIRVGELGAPDLVAWLHGEH